MLSIVIIHRGYKDYLRYNLEITSRNNNVFLIGDQSVKKLESIKNVKFFDIDKYLDTEFIKKYSDAFTNYSPNDRDYELFCFLRIFIIKLFMKEQKLEKIFHLDSDCILFYDINKYPFEKDIAYQNNIQNSETDMDDSIHNGLINIDFCNKFEELYKTIYVNKNTSLIDNKIEFFYENSSKGGICDMTFYYLLRKNNLVDVENLAKPKLINGKEYVFINNISTGQGFESNNQYVKNNSIIIPSIKLFKDKEGAIYIKDKKNGKKFYLFNIHFQGTKKKFMDKNLLNIINDKDKDPNFYNENLEIISFLLLFFLLIYIGYKFYKYFI